MTKLNRAWCAFIFNYDSLSCRFIPHQCVYAAKNLASKLVGIELNPRKKVIGLEARINHVRAIATSLSFNQTEVDAFNLRCMPGGDHRIEVVKVLALQNLESAKTLASQIEDSSSRDLAFYKIVEIEVKENAVSAAATAERIRNLELFSQACAAMAENAPVLYLDRLIQIHQHPFIDPFSRVILQVIIAKLSPPHDFTDAKQAAEQLEYKKNEALSYIAKEEAEYAFDASQATLLLIDDPNERASAQLEVVRKIVLRDIALARLAASKIVRPFFRAFAYIEIAKKDPHFELNDILDPMSKVHQPNQVGLLVELAQVDPKNRTEYLNKAKAIAFSPFQSVDPAVKAKVVEMEALLDIEGAHKTASLVTGMTKIRALIKISQVQRVDNLRIARDAAFSMDDQLGSRVNDDKIDALCEVGSAALDLL